MTEPVHLRGIFERIDDEELKAFSADLWGDLILPDADTYEDAGTSETD